MSQVARETPEKIVYLLGAGFSRPLGLPLVSDFLEKARDAYARDPDGRKSFVRVFQEIAKLALVRNAYHAPLHNVEEVLSLIEMQDSLAAKRSSALVRDFICDVIGATTPPNDPFVNLDKLSWVIALRDHHHRWAPYFNFVTGLFELDVFAPTSQSQMPLEMHPTLEAVQRHAGRYAVVTLNYDAVLELASARIGKVLPDAPKLLKPSPEGKGGQRGVVLAKLHGDVETRKIIPPTWSKGASRVAWGEWRRAYAVLAEATQIRVIGYSLAESDTYVRYLLKAAALKSERLKRFDVLALDDEAGSLKERYKRFVDLPGMRFRSVSTADYLEHVPRPEVDDLADGRRRLRFGSLETAHKKIFGGDA